MATKKYLDYEGLQRLVEQMNKKYAPIAAIIFKGSVDKVADLPTIADQKAGWMYNIVTAGMTTADFVEGAGHEIAAGENVAAVELYTGDYDKVTPLASDDPKAKGWYEEDVVTFVDVTSELVTGDNPQALGLYEQGSSPTEFVPTTDTSVQPSKLYYEREATYKLSQDRLPVDGKDYFTAETEMKWDLMGGIFDLESRYLEFGTEFPQGPSERMVEDRTFLYMGDDKKTHAYVTSPEGRPKDNGYFEGVFTEVSDTSGIVNPKQVPLYEKDTTVDKYVTVTPVGTEDPSQEGWYESDGAGGYVLTADTTIDASKTYYTLEHPYVRTADITVDDTKTYFSGVFTASTDATVDPDKLYYTETALYNKAGIYTYDTTAEDWVAQSSSSGEMIPITNAEIDDLFI